MADELDQIKKILGGDQSNIKMNYNKATVGLNMDQSVNQIKPGTLTYALNAAVENFDSSSVNYFFFLRYAIKSPSLQYSIIR